MQDIQEAKDVRVPEIQSSQEAKDKKSKAKDKTTLQTVANPQKKQAFMNLGPNIPGGRLFTGSVIKGEIPEKLLHLQDIFEKISEIKDLFVEVKIVPRFKAELEQQGTEAYRLYQEATRKIREGALRNGI